MAATDKFAEMHDSIHAGLDNIAKWYSKTNDTDVYFICLGMFPCVTISVPSHVHNTALDPNFKTAYVESAWDSTAYDAGIEMLESRVRVYCCTSCLCPQRRVSLICTMSHLNQSLLSR